MPKAGRSTNRISREKVLRQKLQDLCAAPQHREELAIEPVADLVDQLSFDADREMAVFHLESNAVLRRELGAALLRLEEGTYGLCEECGDPIAEKRLDAVPWARLCVSCQAKAERRHPAAWKKNQRAA